MTFIRSIPEEEAPAEAADFYEEDRQEDGFVSNRTRLFVHRPAVYAAWRQLVTAIRTDMDERRYELVALAAALRLRSSYCMLAHGQVLAERFLDPDVVRAVAVDHRSAGLDALEEALMDFADKVVTDATSVTQEDVDRLRDLGLADEEVFDVAAAAAARCFLSKTLDALGAQPDSVYAELDPILRDALTIGRPIASD